MNKALAIILCSIATFTWALSASAQPHELRTTKFTVSNVDAAVAFYQDLVGMEEVGRFESPGSLIEPFMGFGDEVMRVGLLGYTKIEDIEKTPHPVSVVMIPDIDAVAARMDSANHPLNITSGEVGDGNSVRIGITTDPSGNTIELVESDGPPKVVGARLIVEDRAVAEEFFVRIFDVTPGRRIETDSFDEVFFDFGDDKFVALYEPKGEAPLPKSENPVVAIYSSAFDVVLERVKAGGLGLKEYGAGMFLANDPSGNVVEVVRLQN
ncbi:MAG: VOC family protein [Gammaproteobacteria bacterium]